MIIRIPIDTFILRGILVIPRKARSLVIFTHGSGSSCLSPRNMYIAETLNRSGHATFLPNLLTEEEARREEKRFDIPLLIDRLEKITAWIKEYELIQGLSLGYFGASTGAAAALAASLDMGDVIRAIVSRGGRPDLIFDLLPLVQPPTHLIVGGNDSVVLKLNENAFEFLRCEKEITIIPGATHFFEETGALYRVACLADEWFTRYLRGL